MCLRGLDSILRDTIRKQITMAAEKASANKRKFLVIDRLHHIETNAFASHLLKAFSQIAFTKKSYAAKI
jgi:hypothetical protein